jgi:GH43 family beta-xylosidase
MRHSLWTFIFLVSVTAAMPAQGQSKQAESLTNPLLPSGADPWVIWKDGYYYYTNTLGNRLSLWKTRKIQDLRTVTPTTVWTPPATGPNSKAIWAPELHFLDGKWYLYYTATDAQHDGDATRYVFVLENASPDPTKGTWTDKGRINTEYSGLDGTVFEHRGKRYFAYSAYVGPQSVLAIAEMRNPWTLAGKQAVIAKPTEYWEKFGGREILEGPEFLAGPKGQVFIIYSASACWADEYALGMLTADAKADLLDATSWTKTPQPVFGQSAQNNVYAPGHNSFFTSPDGKESWILYHANTGPGQGCDHRRSPRAQKFLWTVDGKPDFGVPVKADSVLTAPATKR